MINIYIAASSRVQRKQIRTMCYLLEARIRDRLVTKHGFIVCEGTLNACELKALKAAVDRLKAPTDICVHSDDDYLLVTMGHFEELRNEQFLKKDGSPLMHSGIMKEISGKVKGTYAGTKHHEYENWMREEMIKVPPERINCDLAGI